MFKENDLVYIYIGDLSLTIERIGLIPQRFGMINKLEEHNTNEGAKFQKYYLKSIYKTETYGLYQEYVLNTLDSIFKLATMSDLVKLVENIDDIDKKTKLLELIEDACDGNIDGQYN